MAQIKELRRELMAEIEESKAICILRWDFFNLALFFNLPKLQFLQSKVELLELINFKICIIRLKNLH